MEAGCPKGQSRPTEHEGGACAAQPAISDPAGRGEQQLQTADLHQAVAAPDAPPQGGAGDLREQSAGGSAAAGSDLPPNKRQRSDALISAMQPEHAPSALFTAFPAGGSAIDRSEITVGTPLSGTVDAISDSSTYFVTLTLAGVDFKGEARAAAKVLQRAQLRRRR